MSSNHRQILKSSAIVGGSSAFAMVMGVIKVKVLALLLGPAGVGLMGIYQNVVSVGATFFGCGMGTSGVRQVAAESDPARRAIVRRALWWGNLTFGLLGIIVMWMAREKLAGWIFGHTRYSTDVGLAGIGVFFTLVSASQTAILQGYLRIADLARVTVASAIGGTLAGIGIAYLFGHAGIMGFVVITPVFGALAGAYYLRRIPAAHVSVSGAQIRTQIHSMMRLGIPFMLSNLGSVGTQLLARWMILQKMNMDAAGHFQASMQISTVYIGFVLQAMSMDYYPRLSAALAESPEKARTLMADQTEMALLLGSPVLVGMIALASPLIWVLYSSEFSPAVSLLAWQSLGNLFKIISWPMAYSLLAGNRGSLFILVETTWNLVFLAIVYVGLSVWGLNAAGVGFLVAYGVYVLVLMPIARSIAGYQMPKRLVKLSAVYFAAGAASLALTHAFFLLGMAAGTLVAALLALYSLRQIDQKVGLRAWIAGRLGKTKNTVSENFPDETP